VISKKEEKVKKEVIPKKDEKLKKEILNEEA
jgi:hypothetical protein